MPYACWMPIVPKAVSLRILMGSSWAHDDDDVRALFLPKIQLQLVFSMAFKEE
jgi:hypothetical protein